MPHSSGGGSHGGGFSGGSFAHGSNENFSRPTVRRADHPFTHGYTYVYWLNDYPYYVYTDGKLDNNRYYTKKTVRGSLIVSIITILVGVFLIISSFNHVPSKLNAADDIRVVDNAEILNDSQEKEIIDTLDDFKKSTGIAVEFKTVNNEDWQNYYDSLEDYAYEQYVIDFVDEEGWLIVYSEPENKNADFDDWYWWGMQGDDTDEILSEDITYNFDQSFQKGSYRNEDMVSTLITCLNEAATDAMTPKTDIESIIAGGVFVLAGLLIILCITLPVYTTIKKRGYSDDDLKEVDSKAIMITCPYCGKQFFNTGFKKCPFCKKEL